MTFRELLEKYKNHTATPEERKQVEAELEKYNALTEYLLEQDVDMEGEDLAGQQEELQKIDRSMKKRGRRIIAIAVVIACVVMGALTAFQPPSVRLFGMTQRSGVCRNLLMILIAIWRF